jgi:hypothetical protein
MKLYSTPAPLTNIARIMLCSALILCIPFNAPAKVKSKKITISTAGGCIIFVDGKRADANPAEIRIEAYTNAIVKVEKPGYITQEKTYINDDDHEVPREDFFNLEIDEAVQSSSPSETINRDINLKTTLDEDAAWKLISHTVTTGFDVIEVTDRSSGYLRTGWVVKNFNSATIRTRIIIKEGSSSPLVYKAKLVSEIGKAGSAVAQDDNFKPWDRVLRTYENIIPDMQNRLVK